jgi:hypothetical protein
LEVLIELLRVLEAFKHIVAGDEALGTSINGIGKLELLSLVIDPKLTLIQLIVELIENQRDQFCVLVADIAQAKTCLSQVLRSEELVSTKPELKIVNQLLHPPALVKLNCRIVSMNTTFVASGSHSGPNVGKSLHCSLRVKSTVS